MSPPTTTTKTSSNDITGFRWLLGEPVGAAVVGGVSYILNQNNEQKKPESTDDYQQKNIHIYTTAAKEYLTDFSENAFVTLYQYEKLAAQSIEFQEQKPVEINKQNYQIHLINNLF